MINNSVKRVTLFSGHYGSGKTNVAVNYAMYLRSLDLPVAIADLDVVNPYFRTKDSIEELKDAGIRLVSSDYAGSNVDFPALPGELYSLFDDRTFFAVLDIGGDDRGAMALGRYREQILKENDFNHFLVINKYRPLTATPELCVEVMNEIVSAAGIPFTGIVNNSNLGEETAWDDIEKSFSYAERVSELSGIPVVFTTFDERVSLPQGLDSGCINKPVNKEIQGNESAALFSLKLQKKIFEEV